MLKKRSENLELRICRTLLPFTNTIKHPAIKYIPMLDVCNFQEFQSVGGFELAYETLIFQLTILHLARNLYADSPDRRPDLRD